VMGMGRYGLPSWPERTMGGAQRGLPYRIAGSEASLGHVGLAEADRVLRPVVGVVPVPFPVNAPSLAGMEGLRR
jgi:hypothetical protein